MANFRRPMLSWCNHGPQKSKENGLHDNSKLDSESENFYSENESDDELDNTERSESEERKHDVEMQNVCSSYDHKCLGAMSDRTGPSGQFGSTLNRGLSDRLTDEKRGRVTKTVRLKLVVLGDTKVGKTHLISRYVCGEFGDTLEPTLGVDFALKTVEWSQNVTVDLQIWDVAGCRRHNTQFLSVCLEGSDGCLLVCDVTSRATMAAAVKWKAALESQCSLPEGSPVPCVLVGNKADLRDVREVHAQSLHELSARCGCVGWRDVSAKEGTGVHEAFQCLLHRMLVDRDVISHTTNVGDTAIVT